LSSSNSLVSFLVAYPCIIYIYIFECNGKKNIIDPFLRKIGSETYAECTNSPDNRNPTHNPSRGSVVKLDPRGK
jgi:hypothetical protein